MSRIAQFTSEDIDILASLGVAPPVVSVAPATRTKATIPPPREDSPEGIRRLGDILNAHSRRPPNDDPECGDLWDVRYKPWTKGLRDREYLCSGLDLDFEGVPRSGDVIFVRHPRSSRRIGNFEKVERISIRGGVYARPLRWETGFTTSLHVYTADEIECGDVFIEAIVRNPEVIVVASEEVSQ